MAGCHILDSDHGVDLWSGDRDRKTWSTAAQITGVVAAKVKVVEVPICPQNLAVPSLF